MFEIIRKSNPFLPIIMLSKPKPYQSNYDIKCAKIIENTYIKAKQNGDENVYFINGKDLFTDEFTELATVDGIHPNDVGFYCMANAISKILEIFL